MKPIQLFIEVSALKVQKMVSQAPFPAKKQGQSGRRSTNIIYARSCLNESQFAFIFMMKSQSTLLSTRKNTEILDEKNA